MVIKNTIPTHLKKNSIKHSEKWVIIVSIWTVLPLLIYIFNNNNNNNNKIEQMSLTETLIKSIMIVQLYVVKLAETRRLKNCYFLDNKDLLSLSSAFIYDNNR